uniref:Endonuclease n=1 Tax=Blastobotrys adeninivorans TaxID=409370 RepID=A0A060T622_BLAAD
MGFWSSSSPSPSPSAPSDLPTPPPSPVDGSIAEGLAASAAVQSSALVNPAGYFQKYGFPAPIHDVANRGEFISVYDRRTRNPYYVVEHITAASLARRDGSRDQSVFKEDEQVPEKFRARLRDYFRSGYDRGHQAPAADAKYSQQAMDDTFYLTNMCPQVGAGFNRDYWSHFEYFVRGLVRKYPSVRVVTGPLYLPKKDPADGKWKVTYEVIGNPPNIAVPTHFFKIIVGEDTAKNDVAVGAFVLPNEQIDNSTPLKSFYVPLNAIERATGVEFLPKLPEKQQRDLCREVKCELVVREFDKASKALPAPPPPLALPAPKK